MTPMFARLVVSAVLLGAPLGLAATAAAEPPAPTDCFEPSDGVGPALACSENDPQDDDGLVGDAPVVGSLPGVGGVL